MRVASLFILLFLLLVSLLLFDRIGAGSYKLSYLVTKIVT